MDNKINTHTTLTNNQRTNSHLEFIPKANRQTFLPLSFAQQRMWFLLALLPKNTYSNVTYVYQLTGSLHKDALQASLADLVQRHEVMRTTIDRQHNQPVQTIHVHKEVNLHYVDLLLINLMQQTEKIHAIIESETTTVLNLAKEVFRFTLIATAKNQHTLVVTLHPIIAGEEASEIFIHDFCAFYLHHATDMPLALPKLAVQYVDYACWQRTAAFESLSEQALAYWRPALENTLQQLELPTDRKRSDAHSYRGAMIKTQLDSTATFHLKKMSRERGVNEFTLLFAAYALMMRCISGETDFVIGMPIDSRTHDQLVPLIGLFENALPIRVIFSDSMTLNDLIAQLQCSIMAALDNQDLPFERLVDEIKPIRNTHYNPLFQHIFSHQEESITHHVLPDLNINILASEKHTVKYDTDVRTYFDNDALTIAFRYDSALFTATTVTRWVDYFKQAILQLIESPQQQLNRINLLSPGELQKTLYEWNKTDSSFPKVCLHQLIEQQARITPDAIAIKYKNRAMHYGHLNQQATLLARHLHNEGVVKADLVGVCQSRSPELMISFLATLKAGAAYIPIAHYLPVTRIKDILLDAKPTIVLVDDVAEKHLSPIASDLAAAGVLIKNVTHYLAANNDDCVQQRDSHPVIVPDDIACVIYTSDTAGKPQGLMVKHHSIVNYLNGYADTGEINEGVDLSIGFDVTIVRLLAPLVTGKCLDLETGESGQPTIFPTPVSIGRPTANVRLYILDAHQQPVPVGTAGELYVGGEGIAKGYLNDPVSTTTRFFASPFVANEKIYRTGNLARYKDDGIIEYLGQWEDQIRIKGHRVDLAEIATCIKNHRAIKACAVVAQKINSESQIITYIVPQNPAKNLEQQPEVVIQNDIEQENKQVKKWEQVFDSSYSELKQTVVTQSTYAGWNSSYTGNPIPEEEMSQWLHQTVERILAQQPKKVLELGCGAGLIVCQLAKSCEHYIASDFSAAAIEYMQRLKVTDHSLHNVTLTHHDAMNTLIHYQHTQGDRVDTIIINSVVQYFPDQEYLDAVIARAVNCVSPGGRIFIGDVRNYNLLEAFHTSVQLFQADAKIDKSNLSKRINNQISHEPELLLAPQYFYHMAQQHELISRVEILPKISAYDNELVAFRYDVILHIDQPREPTSNTHLIDWQATPLDMQDIKQLSDAGLLDGLHLSNVLNAVTERKLLPLVWLKAAEDTATARDFQAFARVYQHKGIVPHQLLEFSRSIGYEPKIFLSQEKAGECFDVIFYSRDLMSASAPQKTAQEKSVLARQLVENNLKADFRVATITMLRTLEQYLLPANDRRLANMSLAAQQTQALLSDITRQLYIKLPVYMWPAYVVSTHEIPVTINGKVNKAELPPVTAETINNNRKSIAPETNTEKTLHMLWSKVLTADTIGIFDNFFALGGSSSGLLQLVAAIQDEFTIVLHPQLVINNPCIGQLAAAIDRLLLAPLTPRPIDLAEEVKANSQFNPKQAEPASDMDDIHSVLLTGATGFLGAYLLVELLESTRFVIFCLVRSENKLSAMEKIIANLQAYGIWQPHYERRIRAIAGDLAKPLLGLQEKLYEQLAIEIDIIYHNGARVNFNDSYQALKASNVDATKTIIQFACHYKQKPVHYVSTLSVFPVSNATGPIQENDELKNWEALQTGYAQSKWVAEQLVHEAHRQGLPVTVYRPGTLLKDNVTANNDSDLIWIPKTDVRINRTLDVLHHERIGLVPVDYVAKAIISNSIRHSSDIIPHDSIPAFHLLAEQYSPLENIHE